LERAGVKVAAMSDAACALLFFGLAKEFRKTVLPSIREHILAHNRGCDVFAHTYNVSETSNPRNSEAHQKLNVSEVFDLTSNVVMDTEDDFRRARNVAHYRKLFPHKERTWVYPTSMDNMIKQWHSIERVWHLMKSHMVATRKVYQRVGLFRLDVLYVDKIDIASGAHANVPLRNTLGSYMNDRLFYGTYQHAKTWATRRFSLADTYVKGTSQGRANGLHSEEFMAFLMRDVRPATQSLCFHRVRAGGQILCDCRCSDRGTVQREHLERFMSWFRLG